MEWIDSDIRDRIERLINTEGMSQRSFALKIGINPTNLNQVMLGNRPVPKKLPSKIVLAFPEVRIDWIMYGSGEMYKQDQQLADTVAIQKHQELLPTRPRLPKNKSEGKLENWYNGNKRSLCQEKPIIAQFSDYDFSLILKNDRMSPKYNRGDEIFFKKALFPEWGNDFLLDTDDGPKFKRIYQVFHGDKEYIKCVSYNQEEFPPFEIKRELVHNFYRCVGVVRIL